MSRSGRRTLIGVGALMAIVLLGVGALLVLVHHNAVPGPHGSAQRYLHAWQHNDWTGLQKLLTDPSGPAVATYKAQQRDLAATEHTVTLGKIRRSGSSSTADFHADFALAHAGPLEYDGTVKLVLRQGHWLVDWTPAAVHPELADGMRFSVARTFSPRAAILDRNGVPITSVHNSVIVGVEPARVSNRAQLRSALHRELGVASTTIDATLDRRGIRPKVFLPLVTVSEAQYDAARTAIYDVPGLEFRRTSSVTAATPELAAHVIGSVGEITAEQLKALGAPYTTGDQVGQNGLEQTYERRLAGTPTFTVNIVDVTAAPVQQLQQTKGIAGQPVKTTIDLVTQAAAERALQGTANSKLVAVQPSTGQILAVVSNPLATAFNGALDGAYPPGSTFKVVTSDALLTHGVAVGSPAACPPTLTVNGRAFRNFEGEQQAGLTFQRAFEISCNTAFIGLSHSLAPAALGNAATQFGFGEKPRLGVPALGATFPVPSDDTARAAAAIGQAKVTASPLAMAGVAATVASGVWRAPRLVLDPAPAGAPTPRPLNPTVATQLKALMLAVVDSPGATGTRAAIAGQTIGGKTGTAEFGTANPPHTHAWFIGFRDDLAFSVLVEDGGVGGRVAAPLARRFLQGGS